MKPTQMCAPLKSFSNSEHLVCFKIQSFKYVSSQHRTHLQTIAKISLLHRFQKLVGVDLELRKLEGAVEAIHENFLYLKSREADMREVSETTNARVAWFSIMSLGLCICVSALQLWHLKRFFRKKKLI